ncbi:MAG: NAD(P)-dependent oxidoreductase [Candidatus Eiseniibacteriota bacterium]
MRVAVLDDYHRVFDDDPAVKRLRQRTTVDVFTEKLPSLVPLRGYGALIALRERTRFDAAFFEAVPGLELIAQTGNHAYHIDLAAATRAGILVGMGSSDTKDMSAMTASTVELTFALMLAVLRSVPQTDRAIRDERWPSVLGRTMYGKRLGILGLGRIGRRVAQLAKAFGMEVLAWGPTLTDARATEVGATRMNLDALLDAVDVVTVHLKLAKESRGLLDEGRLRRIGPRGVLVNTARGEIVDEAALARTLADGSLGGAGLDVFAQEPLPGDSPLRRLENVVMTPHLGWPADLTYRCMAEAVVRIVESYLDGTYEGAVNPEARRLR